MISFTEQHYKLLVREMRLSSQVAESSSVVGPFFWWAYVKDPQDAGDDYLRKFTTSFERNTTERIG